MTPVALADISRYAGPGLFLGIERRVCLECRADVHPQRYYGFKTPITILACERDESHSGHLAVLAGGKPERAA